MVSDELVGAPEARGATPERQRRPVYSVVVPVYRNEETLAAVVERLEGLVDELDGALEAVFVVDGSPDASLLLLRRLVARASGFDDRRLECHEMRVNFRPVDECRGVVDIIDRALAKLRVLQRN